MKTTIKLLIILTISSISLDADTLENKCENGAAFSCYDLGGNYFRAKKPNYVKALKFLNQACDLKVNRACYLLGSIYFRGTGVKKNEDNE